MTADYLVNYTLSTPKPHLQFLHLQAEFPTEGLTQLLLQLAAWRPGRYELGNFAKNIQSFKAYSTAGEPLHCQKLRKDLWQVESADTDTVVIQYTYHAAELNGGSTWVSDDLLYVNPVNCFLFRPDRPDAGYTINLNTPDHWQLATGMTKANEHQLHASDVQQLMDCPFMSSASLWHASYKSHDIPFHIWIYGRHPFNEAQLTPIFKAFSDQQIAAFGDFPVSDYHFLFLFPDHQTRHGVEHENSTVITLGPAETLTTEEGFLEFVGISSHELYHTWNVKALRPAEMMPYDFTQENYSRLGYVTEGVTTYFGDLFMVRSGIIERSTYFKLLEEQLYRHVCNPGRFNMSVADSSFDTWLDGYSLGIPNRKVSIYTEGALTAFLTDVAIRKATGDESSLDNAMRNLYETFARRGVGYCEQDYRAALEAVAKTALQDLFERYIYGTDDYLPALTEAFNYLGISLDWQARNDFAGQTGALGNIETGGYRIHIMAYDTPADRSKLAPGDLITTINGIQVDEHLHKRLALEKNEAYELTVLRHRRSFAVKVKSTGNYFMKPKLALLGEESPQLRSWVAASDPL